ncbi:MAG: ribonuclease HI family protein [candidate division WOR-3 bacterium]
MRDSETGVRNPEYVVQIDGSARFNPGPAGIGVRVIGPDGAVIAEVSRPIGVRTNNQAEYEALLQGLLEAAKLPAGSAVALDTDSELLYYQVTGKYRVKDPALRSLHSQAEELLGRMSDVKLRLVSREQNRATDRLAKMASGVLARKRTDGAA